MLTALGVLALSYLMGAVPFSNIVAHRRAGVDLRDVGTGTSGGSNLYTVAGFGALAVGGLADIIKGAVGPGLAVALDQPVEVRVLAGALAVTGHNWSVFHRWAGGRGISPAMGAGAVLAWPAMVLLALGLSVGRLLHATAPACLLAQLLLVPVLWATHGEYGVAVGAGLAVPMLVKRLTGNALPQRWSRRVVVTRLVYDRDPGPPRRRGRDQPTGDDEVTDPVGGIDPAGLLGTVIDFRDRMRDREDEVNGLNVFPVPDGDTGTNVLLTLEAALAAVDPALAIHDPDGTAPVTRRVPAAAVVDSRPDPLDLPTLCEALTRGIILGARGSSGVILSQAFVAGLSVIATSTEPASKTIAAALERARAAAYDAVAQPVEGTILTVLSAAAAAAAGAADLPLPDLTELVALEARAAVARTPVLLPVLAKAGVVDSGGRALSYGFDALAAVVGGRPLPPPPPVGHAVLTPTDADDATLRAVTPQGGGRYEVVASLSTSTDGAEQVRNRWRQLGDAVVVSGAGQTWRGHVHTDDPEVALAAARDLLGGEAVGDVAVTDLHAQISAQTTISRPSLTHVDGTAQPQTGGLEVVAVVEGAGVKRAYTELGARVVDGEAAPSVQELLEAIGAAQAADVALLPNDSNVLPAANQAAALADKRVHVLPSRHALAGLAALVALDPAAPVSANLEAMGAAMARTRAGRVAPVVRDSVVAVGPVHPGQWIAIADRQAVGVGDSPLDAALALVHHLCTPATELLTIAWGAGASEEQAEQLQEQVSAQAPEDVIDVFDGGHHDAFWISAEDMPDAEVDEPGKGATDRP